MDLATAHTRTYKLGVRVGLVGVIGSCPDWAVELTGVHEHWACGKLGWAGRQHPSVHMTYVAGGRPDQAAATTSKCICHCR